MKLVAGDRAKVIFDINQLQQNTICTIENILNDSIAIIKYGYNNNEDQFANLPISYLKAAIPSELTDLDYRKLVNSNFYVGGKWRLYRGGKTADSVFEITEIKLALNSKDDEVFLKDVKTNNAVSMSAGSIAEAMVVYIPDFEDNLYDEPMQRERKIEVRIGMRVRAGEDVGVITEADEDNFELTIRFIKNEIEQYEKFSFAKISNVKVSDLQELDYRQVVEKSLRIGNQYVAKDVVKSMKEFNDFVKPKDIIEIVEIDLIDDYVLKDVFIVRNADKNIMKLTSYDLLSYFNIKE